MTHKRNASNGEAPPAKRPEPTSAKPEEFASQPKIRDQYVYIVTEELCGPHLETEQTISEAYATLEDANRRVLVRQKELDPEDWDNQYDTFGCCQSKSKDIFEGESWNIAVRRYLLNPPGSVPSSASSEEASPEPKTPLADIATSGEKVKHGPRRCGDPDCGDLACVD